MISIYNPVLEEALMTMFADITTRAREVFPDLKIKYKNESLLMKIMGTLLFFNPLFMKSYSTTLGSTIYFPSEAFIKNHPVQATLELMHEIIHLYDEKKYGKLLFAASYFFPQILSLLFIPALFIIGWKLSLLFLIFLAPLPAVFRMLLERKAYSSSLYVMMKLNNANNFNINLDDHKHHFITYFNSMDYYLMWPFQSVSIFFNNFLLRIRLGEHPVYNEELYKMIDKLLGL